MTTTSSIETIADIAIPDTALVREITEFIRDAEDDLLFHHSRRVFLFGALQGRRRGLQPDLELLYAGAMFHDLGLTERYRDSACASRSTVPMRRGSSCCTAASARQTPTRYGWASPCTPPRGCPNSWIPKSPW